ncbi:anti-sigma factor [Noviherbaspirillum aridicola]|uniref:Regulator of SigK n=1 Tax=Noviherbaspirillum aridicola TaxID=2849687 RepID=A0ABQ4Q1I3_9BURK|nr:anti-sigma factor [Noviherbaspirillum aridicola]GIZ50901.1 anti-sigma K factor RskA [Noviherbaspirillum aridicola]
MKREQLHGNRRLLDMLASEYALGTLRGGARRRFERWLAEDAALRAAVARWQNRLQPMAELLPPARPSPEVWQALESRLGLQPRPGAAQAPAARRGFWLGLREDLAFWRGLGMVSTALATILLSVLLTRLPAPGVESPSYLAMLADDRSQPALVVTGNAARGHLSVKLLAAPPAPDRSLELWALPKEGPPRSLGLVAPGATLPLPKGLSPENVPALAVSLEPPGGSPDKQAPSGPVIYKGAWVRL